MPKEDVEFEQSSREHEEQPPEFLHKYVTMETARLILGSGKMRFQSPIRYNDPFDSQWDPFWPLKTEEALSSHRQLLRTALENQSSWPSDIEPKCRAELLSMKKRILAHPKNEQDNVREQLIDDATHRTRAYKKIDEYLIDQRRRLRALCLSSVRDSVTMWSHYAAEHRGVVLTFRTAGMMDREDQSWCHIQYTSALPKLCDNDRFHQTFVFGHPPLELKGYPILPLVTKSDAWKHEKEWRLLFEVQKEATGDYDDAPVKTNSLITLTMGCRTDRKAFHNLYILARAWNPDIKLQEAFRPLGSLQLGFKDLDPTTL